MSKLSQRQAVMVLNALPGLGPVRMGRLLNTFGGNAAEVLGASLSDLKAVPGVGPETARGILSWQSHFDLEKEEEGLARLGADYVLKGEPGYPARLAELSGAPLGLYVRGSVPAGPCVAIVGTRRATLYGRRIARQIATELARAGVCVVSGLARGIDGEAHEGALATGRTMAFLGCGLDVDYPPEHAELAAKISSNGAVISEYYLGRKPDVQTFPQRNRLISGSADAVLVVESANKGGSMITAGFAAEQGRLVFAVPGRIDQNSSSGCHALIRDGAILATCAKDIIEELKSQFPRVPALVGNKARKSGGKSGTANKCEQVELQGLDGNGVAATPDVARAKGSSDSSQACKTDELAKRFNLSTDECRVLGVLDEGATLHPEAIARICVMEQAEVMSALMLLELKHLVARRADATYECQGRV